MKKITKYAFFFTIFIVMILFKNTNAQNLQWDKHWNYSGTSTDKGKAITIDASGNAYVTGAVNDVIGTDPRIETIKYNASGTKLWEQYVSYSITNNGCAYESGFCIAVDASGNVWVAATAYSATSGQDLTLIKYNSSGTIQANYPKHYSDIDNCYTGGSQPTGWCLAVYNSTNVYIGGSTYTYSTNQWDLIVLKDNTGGAGWSWTYTKHGNVNGSTGFCRATDLKANASNVYVTGTIKNTNQGGDIWTAKLNASTGAQTWGTQYNSASSLDDYANALVVDGSGNVYVAGSTITDANGTDALIVKYNSSGTQQWATTYNNSSYNLNESWTDIATDGNRNLWVGGYMQKSTSDFDYAIADYETNNGTLYNSSGHWVTADPVFYDGAASAPEAYGTDVGYAIEYVPTTNKLYISGKSDEIVNSVKSINITTLAYNASTGSNIWAATYEYGGTDVIVGDDEMTWKYGLAARYNGCWDDVYVEGNSYVAGSGYDYITLKYYCGSCTPCYGPIGGKIANTDDEVQTVLYPNPFSTSAVLSIAPSTQMDNAVLSIYDITGRLVTSISNITSTDILIERGNLKNGLYFYKLTESGMIITNGKFIIAEE